MTQAIPVCLAILVPPGLTLAELSLKKKTENKYPYHHLASPAFDCSFVLRTAALEATGIAMSWIKGRKYLGRLPNPGVQGFRRTNFPVVKRIAFFLYTVFS